MAVLPGHGGDVLVELLEEVVRDRLKTRRPIQHLGQPCQQGQVMAHAQLLAVVERRQQQVQQALLVAVRSLDGRLQQHPRRPVLEALVKRAREAQVCSRVGSSTLSQTYRCPFSI